jgi:hypothetical protein
LKPIIFLSHSSNNDPEVAALVDALLAALEGDGFEVRLDRQRLTGGEDWRDELHRWLAYCHGGIVVLSKKALVSDWVLKEASILSWRRGLAARAGAAAGDSFTLLPIRCAGVDSKAIAASPFKSLAADLPQHLSSSRPDLMAEVLHKLAPLKTAMPADTPDDELLQKIASWIGKARDPLLRQVARRLGADMPAWSALGDFDVSYQTAALLLRAPSTALPGALLPLVEVVPAAELCAIVDVILARSLDGAAGALLAAQTREPGGRRAALLNASRHDLSRLYALRAHGRLPSWSVVKTECKVVGENLVDDLVEQVVAALRPRFDDDDDVLAALNDLADLTPILASCRPAADGSLPEADELRALGARLRRVTFLLLTGASLPADTQLADIRRLVPALGAGREDALRQTIREVRLAANP